MCMMVYIASDEPLPLIEWQEKLTPFCVSVLSNGEKRVCRQFTKQYVAYAGSYQGCSCGFSYDNSLVEDEEDDPHDVLSRESVRQLSEYLSNLVKHGPVEMFSSWDGDQEAEPEGRLVVTPDYFGGDEFAFKERQFLTVVRS